jgi:hypothetical protein
VLEGRTEQACVGLERLVEVMDGHAEMVNTAGDDASDANGGLVLCRGEGADRAHRLGRA